MKIKLTNFANFFSLKKKRRTKLIMRSVTLLFCTTVFGFSPSDITSKNIAVTINKNELVTVDIKQQQQITGTIADSNGMLLPGVNIIIEGTTTGTQSNFDGKYSINAKKGDVLLFSYLGYKSQKITVADSSTIDVAMSEEASTLNEVVIVGYGSRKKATLTGAVSAISGEELLKNQSANITTGLVGQVPGLIINQRAGRPGAEDLEIFIRGKSTLGNAVNNQPLLVIDGIPQGVSGLGRLSQNDIESISVLKDASAAIYGVNAANGVILVKTKRGKKGKPVYSLNSTYSYTQPTVKPNWTNSYETAQFINIEEVYAGGTAVYSDEDLEKMRTGSSPLTHAGPDVNWFDEVYRDWAPQQRHALTVNGGADKINYFFSGEYLSQDGQYKQNDAVYYKQYQFRTNLDFQATNNLKLSVDVTGSIKDRSEEQNGDNARLRVRQAPPESIYTFPNGLPGNFQYGLNPAIMGSSIVGYDETYSTALTGVFRYEYKMDYITKGLSFEGFAKYAIGMDKNTNWLNTWFTYSYDEATGEYTPVPSGNTSPFASLDKRYQNNSSSQLNTYLKYKRTFGDHKFDVLLGMESRQSKFERLDASRSNYTTNIIEQIDAGDILTASNAGFDRETAALSYFGTFNYGYKDKYLIDLIFRADGSYKFEEGNRFGYFPAISAGWVISEEPFFADNLGGAINFMKFRGSWGKMGFDNTDPFQYLATYSPETSIWRQTYLTEDGTPVTSFTLDGYPNPNITWEEQESFDVAVDMQFANGAVDLTVDYFKRKRSKILIARNESVPDYYGLELPDENLGEVHSWGVEGSISYKQTVSDNFSFNIGGNLTFARNRAVFLDEAAGVLNFQEKEGYAVDAGLLYIADGIYQNQDEIDNSASFAGAQPGDIRYVDQLTIDTNGDGIYDEADGVIDTQDRVRLNRSVTPEIVYGVNLGAKYKDFDFTLQMQGQSRAWGQLSPSWVGNGATYDQAFFDGRWQQEGDNQYPIAYAGTNNTNRLASTFWSKSVAFLRVRTLEVGYNFPEALITKLKLNKFRLFVSGNNLFTFDNMPISRDPELDDYQSYEIQKMVTLGINLSF